MLDTVKYQLDKAEDALRTALKLGAATEDPYLLKNIAETINTVKIWSFSYRYNVTKETANDSIKFNLSSMNDYGLDEMPYNYFGGVKGGMGDDIISFTNSASASFSGDTVLKF